MASTSSSAGAYFGEGLKGVMAILQAISDDLPAPASAIINLVQHVISLVEGVKSNQEECGLLRDRLLELLAVVTMVLQKDTIAVDGQLTVPPDLKRDAERLQRTLENIEKEISQISKVAKSKRKRHRLTAVFWVNSHAATLQECRNDLDWAMNRFNVSTNVNNAVHLWETTKKVDTLLTNQSLMSKKTQTVLSNHLLESLPRAKYAGFDCERPDKPSTCFEGTRTAILELITDWITDTEAVARFFWLNGIAGVGKTTVACTIANLMGDLGLLGGQFCFSRRGEAELRNPALVFPTIAYQLARFDPEFGRRITAALEADTGAPFASLKEQLDRLIIKPLAGLKRDPSRIVVLIFDAFDECDTRGAKEILQLLVAAIPSLPFFLKVLVTSRPEAHIRSVLVPAADAPGSQLRITALHDIETSIVKSDILLYLRDRLRRLPEELGFDLPPEWVTDAEIELLAAKAGNLFIHAATALRFLSKGWSLREQLDTLLALITSSHHPSDSARPFAELDQLYLQILLGLIPPESGPQIPSRLRLVLGSVLLLRDPIPVDALERLVGLVPHQAADTLRHLHSVVLTPPPPDDCPRPYHPSFPDFLQDRSRCPNDEIWIKTEEHEGRMAANCLKLLNTKLHKGMLGDLDPTLLNSEVEGLAARVKDVFTPELQYACRYWASHLANAGRANSEVQQALEVFASRSLLPWLEAMSWLGEMSLAIQCMEAVDSWRIQNMNSSVTSTLLHDGYRLLLTHKSTIALGAQHLATSVLPFAPSNAEFVTRYTEYANHNIRVLRGVEAEWPPYLMVWQGHSDAVNSVAYSPDGSRVASASDDQTIRLWDVTTGSCTTTLEGHSSWVWSVAFSPDGSTLASGSDDNNIRTWDTTTGACVAVLGGHTKSVASVAFSRDGLRLASGSDDRTIRLWDSTTNKTTTILQGHSERVVSVDFSPDGLNIASGSVDTTIRIWDLAGRCVNILEGHSGTVHSVTFSPKGTHLASGSQDKTIRIWDVSTKRHTMFQGHSNSVFDVTFTADGSRLASASADATIRMWDTATGECINTFRGHSFLVPSISFSPDDSHLISGSSDRSVRIWDANLTNPTTIPEGHSNAVASVAFSKDGSRLISSSWDCSARIWDTSTGRCLTKLEGRSEYLTHAVFDPDGSRVATGSVNGTVSLWDANTGDFIATLEGLSHLVAHLAFSVDGSYLKSIDGSESHHTALWDVGTGEQVEEHDNCYQFDIQGPTPFQVDNGRLMVTDETGSQRLVCILPPSTTSRPRRAIASFGLGGGRVRTAIGCGDGNIFILEISL